MRARLERGAAFVTQLHRLSIKRPHSWRRAESVGRDINLNGPALELAIRDAEHAGLIQRRADGAGAADGQGPGGSIAIRRAHVVNGTLQHCQFLREPLRLRDKNRLIFFSLLKQPPCSSSARIVSL